LTIAGGGGARIVVFVDGFAVAGGFGQANGTGNDCSHDLFSQVATEVFADLLAEPGPGVVHGENDSKDGERGIETTLFDSLNQVENFSNSFECEVFALDGHEDFFCGDEGAGHEQADAGRAVENDEIESGIESKGVQGLADAEQWVFQSGQLDFSSSKIHLGR